MKYIKHNALSFYKLAWYFGNTNEYLKFNWELRDNSNAIHKWLEYGKT